MLASFLTASLLTLLLPVGLLVVVGIGWTMVARRRDESDEAAQSLHRRCRLRGRRRCRRRPAPAQRVRLVARARSSHAPRALRTGDVAKWGGSRAALPAP